MGQIYHMYLCQEGGGGGVSLSANNIFTGTNTFSALTTINGGLALPSTGIQPSAGQLGSTYFLQGTSFIGPTASAANVATISGSTLSAGTYLVNLVYCYNIANNASGAGVLRILVFMLLQSKFRELCIWQTLQPQYILLQKLILKMRL